MHPLPSGSLAPLLREHREFLLRTRLHSPSVGGLVPIIPSLFKISAAYLVISRIPPLPSPIRPSTGALLQAPAALATRTLAPPGLPTLRRGASRRCTSGQGHTFNTAARLPGAVRPLTSILLLSLAFSADQPLWAAFSDAPTQLCYLPGTAMTKQHN